MKRIFTLTLLFLLAFLPSCQKDETTDAGSTTPASVQQLSSDVANRWFGLSLQFAKTTPGFTPPVAARAFGYLGLALYETCAPGMPGYVSLQGRINGLQTGTLPDAPSDPIHYGLAANRALSVMMLNLYKGTSAANVAEMVALERSIRDELAAGINDELVQNSIRFGDQMGDAVFQYANTDGQEWAMTRNFYASYALPVFQGAWIPTPPAFQATPLQPYWGDVRPFLLQDVASTQPAPPPAYTTDVSSIFYQQAQEVYTTVNNLSPEQKAIALFWSDDPVKTPTPPGHSMSILRQVLGERKANLATAAEAYARMGMAQHDAFVSCWKCKYQYSLLRPISYIRAQIDPTWVSLLSTPPFPEYTSGHSVQSA
ncbi:MAG TPA: vanadium-dependent haloperoxidase, partial [Saprospiraceae bacterium]|nr:vanadium-dependent haloperoxidase [Saprospiraceae bacterium]